MWGGELWEGGHGGEGKIVLLMEWGTVREKIRQMNVWWSERGRRQEDGGRQMSSRRKRDAREDAGDVGEGRRCNVGEDETIMCEKEEEGREEEGGEKGRW